MISPRRQKRGLRLLLFPVPFQGHVSPMIQLGSILHSKGFIIHVIHTKYNYPNPSNYPHFTFHLLLDGLPDNIIGPSASDPRNLTKLLTSTCQAPFLRLLSGLLSDNENNNRFACLITDNIWYFAQAAADKFNIPRIALRTTSASSFLASLNQDREHPPPPVETEDHDSTRRIVHSMVEETKKASALIFNTFAELEAHSLSQLREHFPTPTFAVGPFHKRRNSSSVSTSLLPQDGRAVSWLDEQAPESVLYVSFGSMASMGVDELLEAALGLANSMVPFLWVVRPGLVRGSEWIEMLPSEFLSGVGERSLVVKWAPQEEVLSHFAVGGFWTHCGWNSTVESMCEGVPMMCSPFFGHQIVNSRYVSEVWRIGIEVEKGGIEEAIRTLMGSKRGGEMRKRAMHMKEKIEVCLNSGGSSYKALEGLIDLIASFEPS